MRKNIKLINMFALLLNIKFKVVKLTQFLVKTISRFLVVKINQIFLFENLYQFKKNCYLRSLIKKQTNYIFLLFRAFIKLIIINSKTQKIRV